MSRKPKLSDLLKGLSSEDLSKKVEQDDGLTKEQLENRKNKIFIKIYEKISEWVPYFIGGFMFIILVLFLVVSFGYLYLIWGNEEKIFNVLKDVIWTSLVSAFSYFVGKTKN